MIRIIIQRIDENNKYVNGSSRNIKVTEDGATVDEMQNIVLNALARYGIKHKYSFPEMK